MVDVEYANQRIKEIEDEYNKLCEEINNYNEMLANAVKRRTTLEGMFAAYCEVKKQAELKENNSEG